MKAVIYTKYGSPDVLQPREVDKPVCGEREILIRIYATTVNYGDITARNFRNLSPREFNMLFIFWLLGRISFGLTEPKIKILGSEFAGEVEATGKEVKRFSIGDKVFGYTGQKMGAYAEYICMPEDGCLTIKPANMSYEEAAAVPMGAIMALNLLRKAKVRSGQKVLINGASGSIGSAAVQIAKSFGAEVTGVCGTRKLEFVKALGADKVIDYTKEDFTGNGETYDLIFDILGRSSYIRCKDSLKQNGRYFLVSFKTKQLLQMLWTSIAVHLPGRQEGKRVICAIAPGSVEDLIAVRELAEAGKIKTIIDKCFPLELAAEAHLYVENGHNNGKVAILIS